eukprot:2914067-Rhodomonas_salina.1
MTSRPHSGVFYVLSRDVTSVVVSSTLRVLTSGTCCAGTCGTPDLANGEVCSANCQCQSSDGCVDDKCGKKEDGAACASDDECDSSDGCVDGKCG